jgi:DNA-binding NtrC family response regulator
MGTGGETFDDSGLERPGRSVTFAPHLFVVLECDRPTKGGARFSLERVEAVKVGRGDTRGATRRSDHGVATLDVRVPGRSMSSSHARLVRTGNAWAIQDEGSRNGTFVNGRRVDRAILRPGDVIELGHTVLLIGDALPTPPDAAPDVDLAAPPDGFVTLDPDMASRLEALARIAPSPMSILLLGETGSGKEVLAQQVHRLAARTGPMIAVNCGAIPEALVESQLFGHRKGAFSGAVSDEIGFVRAADGGTLFLDEIGDLPKTAQAALLRVIQEREVIPVGHTRGLKVDVRVIAATHLPLEEMVDRGDFRRDLFARVAAYRVRIPPLRERRTDLGVLVASLLRRMANAPESLRFTPEAGRALVSYGWPLNVRELEQCLTMAIALSPDGVVDLPHLPPAVATVAAEGEAAPDEAPGPDETLRLSLLTELAKHHGNIADVARAMGKARMQVHRWCKRFGINPDVYRK